MTIVLKIKTRRNSKRKFATSAGQTGEDPLKKQHVFFDSKDHRGCLLVERTEQRQAIIVKKTTLKVGSNENGGDSKLVSFDPF